MSGLFLFQLAPQASYFKWMSCIWHGVQVRCPHHCCRPAELGSCILAQPCTTSCDRRPRLGVWTTSNLLTMHCWEHGHDMCSTPPLWLFTQPFFFLTSDDSVTFLNSTQIAILKLTYWGHHSFMFAFFHYQSCWTVLGCAWGRGIHWLFHRNMLLWMLPLSLCWG